MACSASARMTATEAAAVLFASSHKRRDPGRDVEIRFPDGMKQEV